MRRSYVTDEQYAVIEALCAQFSEYISLLEVSVDDDHFGRDMTTIRELESKLNILDGIEHNNLAENQIDSLWCVDDVLSVRPNLTEEQAREVLEELLHHHDAEVGINWDVIKITADMLFPQEESEEESEVE